MTNERNYGIDLLRIVAMFLICVLHVISQGGILPSVDNGSVSFSVLSILRVCTLCGVNCFALISGYATTNKPLKYSKIANMWFQAFFYSFVMSLILSLAGVGTPLAITDLVKLAFPVTFNQFWYFSSYFLLFFAMPILNSYLFSLDKASAQKAFILLVILSSGLSFLTDPFQSVFGYSALWLILLYCMGILARKIHLFEAKKTCMLIILLILSTLISWALYIFDIFILTSYIAPTILLNSLILVVLFSRIRPKGKIIARITPFIFGVYLFQMSYVVWNGILQDGFCFLATQPLPLLLFYVFLFAACIFISGLIIEFLRSKLAHLLRLHLLSEKVVAWINSLLKKVSILTK